MDEIKTNEIYQLGVHRLLCGDGLDPVNIARLLGCKNGDPVEEHYDLMLTNPPFPGRNENEAGYRKLWCDLFKNWNPNVFYGWLSAMQSPQFINMMTDLYGYEIRQQLVWLHDGRQNDRYPYKWGHIPCVYAKKPDVSERWLNLFDNFPSTVFYCRFMEHEEDIARKYPTAKPSRLYSEILRYHDCYTIVDPFAGTGPLIKACETLGKRAILAEIDPDMCRLIIDQWQKFTGRRAIKSIEIVQTSSEHSELYSHI